MKLTKQHWIILAILITEVLGFSLILPFLPFYAKEFGASPLQIGLILTSFSFFQFLSAPIMGKLSDHYGRRPLLLLSQLSTFISFIILGFSNSLWMIALSRIVDGMLGSNNSIAQAYLSDISTKKNRSKIFGLSGVAFGFGFMIGPAIGGFLAKYSFALPSFLAAAVSLVTILMTYFLLPETVKRNGKKFDFKLKILDIHNFSKYFFKSESALKLRQFFTYILSHLLWTSSFAIYADFKYGLGPAQVGIVAAYIGVVSIVMRGFLIPKLIDKFGEKRLVKIGVLFVLLGLIAVGFSHTLLTLIVAVNIFAIGSGMMRPLMMGAISRSVSDKEQGAVLGVANSLNSLAQIIAPLAGGYVLSNFPPDFLIATSVMTMILGFLINGGGVLGKNINNRKS